MGGLRLRSGGREAAGSCSRRAKRKGSAVTTAIAAGAELGRPIAETVARQAASGLQRKPEWLSCAGAAGAAAGTAAAEALAIIGQSGGHGSHDAPPDGAAVAANGKARMAIIASSRTRSLTDIVVQ